MLAHEIWLGQRLQESRRRGSAAYPLVRVHATPAARHFYARFDWHGGQTLEQLLAAGPLAVDAAVALARSAGQALSLLHAARCVHRDLKPANLHLSQDGQWRLLDLGVALSPRAPRALAGLHAGTPSYINPEQWDEPARPPDAGSDLYALGVTLYQALTGRLPFGELEPWQDARKRRAPVAVSRLNPQVPIWLDRLVMRAIARESKERFETADEWLLELERGAAREPAVLPRSRTLGQRDPLLLWQIGLGVSLLFNLLLVLWLLVLPKG